MPIKQSQFSITSILILTSIAAILVAIPRLTAGVELHPTTILWIVTLHQIAVALTIAIICWLVFARRMWVGVTLALLIVILWGPNLGATIEYSITGKNTNFIAAADAIGATPYLNRFYAATYDWLGYSYKATAR